jgi:hypothetical protein
MRTESLSTSKLPWRYFAATNKHLCSAQRCFRRGPATCISKTYRPQPGFYGLRVEGPEDFGQVESNGVTTLAIVVTTGKDRGQALACACSKAEVTKWWEIA